MRVDADDVAALGESLLQLSHYLSQHRATADQRSAMGRGSAGGALDAVLSDWELRRHEICAHLDRLGESARTAGAAYISTEAAVERLAGVAGP